MRGSVRRGSASQFGRAGVAAWTHDHALLTVFAAVMCWLGLVYAAFTEFVG
jgi:hypothetical protein